METPMNKNRRSANANSPKPTKPSAQTKADRILKLLQRNSGATIAELARATGWQRHSVHGFMSGTLKKKQGYEIKNTKDADRDRRYQIEGDLR
jgi:DNA-binding IclR family transcriptional regulator